MLSHGEETETISLTRLPTSGERLCHRFGVRLRALREAKGYSRKRLANSLGLDDSLIADIELGTLDVRLDWLEDIAFALDLSIADLLHGL